MKIAWLRDRPENIIGLQAYFLRWLPLTCNKTVQKWVMGLAREDG
jgi:hypothetical protein